MREYTIPNTLTPYFTSPYDAAEWLLTTWRLYKPNKSKFPSLKLISKHIERSCGASGDTPKWFDSLPLELNGWTKRENPIYLQRALDRIDKKTLFTMMRGVFPLV